MTPEKILEIARRYTVPETESRILFDKDGNATGGTVTMTYWNFCEEELIAFAKSVIEADRQSGDEPMAWLTLGRDMGSNRDIVTFSRSALIPSIPLYTRPAPARKPLSDEERDLTTIKVPTVIFDKLKDVNTVTDLINALKAAEKTE